MTRRILALFAPGLLMAQKAKPHYTTGRMCLATEADDCQVQRPRPRNGQCPVCGTMAPAFNWGDGIPPSQHYADSVGFDFGPDKGWQIRICAYCNITFRQWAEGKEPKR